jgi:hypothetical protein
MRKQPKLNGTPGKKPPALSLKLRLGRTPLEQRSGSKPLEQSAKRIVTVEGGSRSAIQTGSGASWS